ncbi:hypothetical protein M0G74_06665 [Microbulbifer sp. CAU 1566]|uniref:hypothetical protein n=1 Tax=Microbulbifer sp. CAU 1566 TaxID=2933269 RepID=UPI00200301F4|nr:hypothetical protein [Microbulbifer sp. CAU 1566]MCK7596953.1 hypothetical protein [Microbulbifer sp. CAU 1566]
MSLKRIVLLLSIGISLFSGLYFLLNQPGQERPFLGVLEKAASGLAVSKSEVPATRSDIADMEIHERDLAGEGESEASVVLRGPPDVAYRQFIEQAERGESRAQLVLSVILDRCSHSSVRSREQLDELQARGDLSAEMLAEYSVILDKCSALYELLGEHDINALQAFWLNEAAGELTVARVAYTLSETNTQYSPDLYQLLQTGLSDAKGDWLQERSIRQSASTFFTLFIEPSSVDLTMGDPGYYRRAEDSLAWQYLGCEASVHCDLQVFEAQVSDHFYEYEVSTMLKRAEELDRAITEGDWSQLGLQL